MAGNSVQFVNQANLHFGQKHTPGGVNVWLCQSADNPAPAAVADPKVIPFCPSPSRTVTVTIRPGVHIDGFPRVRFAGSLAIATTTSNLS
jgi:hypothetical protein